MNSNYPQIRALWLAMFTDVLGMAIIIPILPVLAVQYQFDSFLLGLLIASNAIFGFLFSPIFGKLTDQYGRKPLLMICQFGTILGFIVLIFSDSIILILLARIIDGIFSGQLTICQSVVSDIVPPKDRGKVMTTIGSAFTFAYIFGPSVGGVVFEYFGIRGLGLTAVCISIFNLIYSYFRISESHPAKILQKPDWMMMNQEIFEIKEKNNLTNIPESTSVLNNKTTFYILMLYGMFILTATPFESTISLFSYIQINLSTSEIGLLFTCMAIFQVSFRVLLFTPIHSKIGDTKSVIFGFIIYLTAYFLLALKTDFWYFLLIMMYLTLGAVFTRGIIVSFATRTIDEHSQGKLMGIISSIEHLGQIIGPFIGTFLLLELSSSTYLVTLMFLAGITLLMSFRLVKCGFDKSKECEPH